MNQITVGRNSQSTIVVSSQYNTVSGNHATITREGNAYILEDHSTNGTYVNGMRIHHASCQIRPGDQITLGMQYVLDFNTVQNLLGSGYATQRYPEAPATARVAPMQAQQQAPLNQQININMGAQAQQEYQRQRETPACLNQWSWGAFYWGWIWGVGNGVYWPLITLIPYVGQIAALIIAFILGANGNRYAWDKYTGTAAEFDEKQHNWAVAAGICFLIEIVIVIFVILAMALGS